MYTTLITLINLLDSNPIADMGVIPWGSPVPSFGDLSNSRVATLGLNPSNREFVDQDGNELEGKYRRFHTLNSLGITSWSDVDARHIKLMVDSFRQYFLTNPYDRWFKVLDLIISGTKSSYYSKSTSACHLDLIPYATSQKWNDLSPRQHAKLLALAGGSLGFLVRDSSIKILILNGRSVVEIFQDISGINLDKREMPTWSLPRRSTQDVIGLAYHGVSETLSGVPLGRELLVLGYNHNLQSSFGVTKKVLQEIQKWVSESSHEVL